MGFINATGAISGLWTASDALGVFCGATIGGIVVDAIGFGATSAIFLVIYISMSISDIVEAMLMRNCEMELSRY